MATLKDVPGGAIVGVRETLEGFVARSWAKGAFGRDLAATLLSMNEGIDAAILGWRKGERYVPRAWDRSAPDFADRFGPAGSFPLPPPDFVRFTCVKLGTECIVLPYFISKPRVSKDGEVCRRCRSRNEYAVPNRPDGSYVCFECRT